MDIDASAADVYDTVTVAAGDGSDRLHLTGELYKNKSGEDIKPIDGNENALTLKNKHYTAAESEKSAGEMQINLTGIEKYTDALVNKRTEKITSSMLQAVEGQEKEIDGETQDNNGEPGTVKELHGKRKERVEQELDRAQDQFPQDLQNTHSVTLSNHRSQWL